MRILYLHNSEYRSSMANLIQVKAMCNAMSNQQLNVTLSLQASNKNNVPINFNYPYNVNIRKQYYKNKKIDKYLNTQSIKEVINRINPELIYLRSPLLLYQVKSAGKPIIIELHNNKLHQGYTWLDKYWSRFLINIAKTDQILKVVCISQALSNYWHNKGIPSEKIITAHDGIDHYMFQKLINQHDARAKLNLPLDNRIVTYTGRLYKNRKIENIIKLAEVYSDTLFLVVGGPDEQSELFKKFAVSNGLKNIIFTGQIRHNEIPTYLYASDVLLGLWSSDVPTINYCSPLKVFEYMAAARIIVAHGFPTIKEVLKHNHNAILVEPDSLNDLIQKTGDALKINSNSKLAKQAREDVLNLYTWEQRAKLIFQGINCTLI